MLIVCFSSSFSSFSNLTEGNFFPAAHWNSPFSICRCMRAMTSLRGALMRFLCGPESRCGWWSLTISVETRTGVWWRRVAREDTSPLTTSPSSPRWSLLPPSLIARISSSSAADTTLRASIQTHTEHEKHFPSWGADGCCLVHHVLEWCMGPAVECSSMYLIFLGPLLLEMVLSNERRAAVEAHGCWRSVRFPTITTWIHTSAVHWNDVFVPGNALLLKWRIFGFLLLTMDLVFWVRPLLHWFPAHLRWLTCRQNFYKMLVCAPF